MEDLSCLWENNDLEPQFIELVKLGLSHGEFVKQAEMQLGRDWQTMASDIILNEAPELYKKLKAYLDADKDPAKKD